MPTSVKMNALSKKTTITQNPVSISRARGCSTMRRKAAHAHARRDRRQHARRADIVGGQIGKKRHDHRDRGLQRLVLEHAPRQRRNRGGGGADEHRFDDGQEQRADGVQQRKRRADDGGDADARKGSATSRR